MTLLDVRDLRRLFPLRRGSFLHAVDDISFSVARGEAIGLVGESGCGKSTLARLVARLDDPTAGTIVFDGIDIGETMSVRAARAPWRPRIQMVFQDPYESLDPRKSIRQAVELPLIRLRDLRGAALERRVDWALDRVHLAANLANRLPHQLSGGQLARAGIARAIAPGPELLILDEPTSALDVSVQAVILRLLNEMRRDFGLSLLFVSHDLNVVRLLCQRVMVMYGGRIVEEGASSEIFAGPAHPYTASLVAAVPMIGPGSPGRRLRIPREPRSPIDPSPTVCRFEGRCFRSAPLCRREAPKLTRRTESQSAACHFPLV